MKQVMKKKKLELKEAPPQIPFPTPKISQIPTRKQLCYT